MATVPLLEVSELSVRFATDAGPVQAVDRVSFELDAGEVLGIVGESGSGKTVTCLSLVRLLPEHAEVTGRAMLDGVDLLALSGSQLRAVRGREIAYVFQEPMTSLNPALTVGRQIGEVLERHEGLSRADARMRAIELLELVRIQAPERRVDAHPHQLSGGMQQRVMIAMALACGPRVLVADEPTTALDTTTQAGILDLLADIRERLGTAIVLVTHNLGVVAELADRVLVMHGGRVVEQAPVEELFDQPRHPYTAGLLGAVPRAGRGDGNRLPPGPAPAPLEVVELVKEFDRDGRLLGGKERVRAVDGVSFALGRGEILGLVGESGSGKSTVAHCIARLLEPTSGRIRLNGVELTELGSRRLRPFRRELQLVFQDTASSLDPRMLCGAIVAEPLRLHRLARGREAETRVAAVFDAVGLRLDLRHRHPHELSGGERQRVALARALVLEPTVLIADEPVSALDVPVQAAILDLLRELQRGMGFSCLFITHDLATVEFLCDRVAVMAAGRIVETGSTASLFSSAQHHVTRALLAASLATDPRAGRRRRQLVACERG